MVELLGRNRLVNDLLQAGLEVALPLRDRGVDLIAYADLSGTVRRFVARPIQMKASLKSSFAIDRKYARIRDLLIAYVWHLEEPAKAAVYVLTYPQAVAVAAKMGYTRTASWRRGRYVNTRPSPRLTALLERSKVSGKTWWGVIAGSPARSSESG
ncbi:MAG: hypothetical protein L0338_33420 [Acidobacteria bacterium]|nr:hypothetical protein [Acidobacteriota bacterium]